MFYHILLILNMQHVSVTSVIIIRVPLQEY